VPAGNVTPVAAGNASGAPPGTIPPIRFAPVTPLPLKQAQPGPGSAASSASAWSAAAAGNASTNA
jgi:hypothetical protein